PTSLTYTMERCRQSVDMNSTLSTGSLLFRYQPSSQTGKNIRKVRGLSLHRPFPVLPYVVPTWLTAMRQFHLECSCGAVILQGNPESSDSTCHIGATIIYPSVLTMPYPKHLCRIEACKHCGIINVGQKGIPTLER